MKVINHLPEKVKFIMDLHFPLINKLFPRKGFVALVITNGLIHDGKLAIPLMKRAGRYMKKHGYILADKAYDDTDIVA